MIELHHMTELSEYDACVALQRATWGEEFADVVPASLLQVSAKIGGLVAGAYEGDRLLGFVYSLLGFQDGSLVHWSHMLAVDREARGQGLGRRLKLFQRAELLKRSVEVVFWTFDPMVSRNAHLNITRLGASISGFVPNMYGHETGSRLHPGGETDRFIARWDLKSSRVRWAIDADVSAEASEAVAEAPMVTLPEAGEAASDVVLPEGPSVRIAIPCDLIGLGEQDPERLRAWREIVRRAFLTYPRRNYAVQSFHHEAANERCYYYLRRP